MSWHPSNASFNKSNKKLLPYSYSHRMATLNDLLASMTWSKQKNSNYNGNNSDVGVWTMSRTCVCVCDLRNTSWIQRAGNISWYNTPHTIGSAQMDVVRLPHHVMKLYILLSFWPSVWQFFIGLAVNKLDLYREKKLSNGLCVCICTKHTFNTSIFALLILFIIAV